MTWKVIEKREQASPLLGFIGYFYPLAKDAKKIWGIDLDTIVEFRNRSARMIIPLEKWYQIEKITLKKLAGRKFIQKMEQGFRETAQNLNLLGVSLLDKNFSKLTNIQLAILFNRLLKNIMDFSTYSHWINGCDFEFHLFTKKLIEILKKHIKTNINKTFITLTTSTKDTLQQIQEKDILIILKIIKESKLSPKSLERDQLLKRLLINHTKKYSWLFYEQEGNPLSVKYFQKILINALKQEIDPNKELVKIKKKRERFIKKKKKLEKKLNLSKEERYWFDLATKISHLKILMREIKVRAYCQADGLMTEIAKRLKLNKYQIRHLMPQELNQALGSGRIDTNLLNKRIKHSVFYFTKDKINAFVGTRAKKWSQKFKEDTVIEKITELKGNPAYPGKAIGKIRQVLSPKDMAKFKKGNILVAYMTDPGVVPAMKKAAAIITDIGGITCHAAIVSRELKIPCVVGTKIATKVLKNGDLVEVDATKGVIKKI